jgi:Ca-activated chloride channel family protein
VGETESAGQLLRGRRYRLLAASVLLAVVGGFLAYRVFREASDPPAATPPPRPMELRTPPPATTEIGLEAAPTERDTAAAESTPSELSPPSVRAESTARENAQRPASAVEGEERAGKRIAGRPDDNRAMRDNELEAARQTMTEIGPEVAGGMLENRLHDREAAPGREPAEPEELQALGHVSGADPGVTAKAQRRMTATDELMSVQPRGRRVQPHTVREIGAPQEPPASIPGPSTGGTTEPNDQPWGDMFFRPYGTNPFVDTEDDPQSTFGLDVDTGSYTLARSYLERGHLPPPEAIRVEEFINFFDYRDRAPRRGEFTLSAEGAPSPWTRGPRYQLLRIGIHGREISAAQRRDATLIFVIDVSGSMARENRLLLVKQALNLLLDQLGRGDRVGLVVYGSSGRILLEPSGDLAAVRRAIDRLSTGGSTNAEEGLVLGYDLARRHFRSGAINRLVLCSDGVANVGRTGPESILARIGREAQEGIELTTVGFGMGNYNDVLMEQLADRGDGNYAYVDTVDEARRVFVENLTGTLQTIASDAKVQVEFDPGVVSRYRLLGYENRDVADHRFRDDTVDAGEIGAGHQVTALYEVKLTEGAPRRSTLGEIRLRYRSRATGRVVEDSLEIDRSQLARSWRAASPSLQLAALAAELAEVLKGSYWAKEIRPEELRERARTVGREFSGDHDVAELVDLVRRASRLIERRGDPLE